MKRNLLILPFICLSAYARVEVVRVENTTNSSVTLEADGSRATTVRAHTKKNVSLPLAVAATNQAYLQAVILNRVHIPEQELKIIAGAKTFFMWVDSRGVILARELTPGVSRSEAVPHVVLSASPEQMLACSMKIDQSGISLSCAS